MSEQCTDNRFELIKKYKSKLIESTNIECSPDEMKVIDNIMFRFWQMKWLDAVEKQIPIKIKRSKDSDYLCPICGTRAYKIKNPNTEYWNFIKYNYCSNCGQALDWSDKDDG